MPDPVAFDFRLAGKRHFATPVGGSEFYLGRETKYGTRIGLGRGVAEYWGLRFRAADYPTIGHWGELLELTGHCESANSFNCINSYDRAGFTFGFYQLAAHTPDDNLILLLRRAAALPEAAVYLPGLLPPGRQLALARCERSDHRSRGDRHGRRRTAEHRAHAALNPDPDAVGKAERSYAARLTHWSEQGAAFRQAQVDVAFAILAKKMRVYDARYGLDGKSDTVCAVIADIHHQGRAKVSAVRKRSPRPIPRRR